MADKQVNEELNRIVICLGRNLVQYIGESWPWAEDHPEKREAVDRVVRRQQESVRKLVELLEAREEIVDFGTYPDYSEYHYIALDYVLDRLIAVEKGLIAEIQRAQGVCDGDPEALELLREIASAEQENLKTLEAAVEARRSAAPAQAASGS